MTRRKTIEEVVYETLYDAVKTDWDRPVWRGERHEFIQESVKRIMRFVHRDIKQGGQ